MQKGEALHEDDTAADEFLLALQGMPVRGIPDNPMDVAVVLSGKGKDLKRTYRSGSDRIVVTGDPYAAFDEKRR